LPSVRSTLGKKKSTGGQEGDGDSVFAECHDRKHSATHAGTVLALPSAVGINLQFNGFQMESNPTLEGMKKIVTLSYNHLPYELKALHALP